MYFLQHPSRKAIVFNYYMDKPKKRIPKLESSPIFEEADHRLACGWHVDIEGSGQRKRYLRSIKAEQIAWTVSTKRHLQDSLNRFHNLEVSILDNPIRHPKLIRPLSSNRPSLKAVASSILEKLRWCLATQAISSLVITPDETDSRNNNPIFMT